MNELEHILRLMEIVIDDLRHPYYDRVVDLADMYRKFVTGEDLDDMMERFAKREDTNAFEQRKEITQHIIPSVVSNLTSVERKVPRSNGITRVLTYKDNEKSKKAEKLEGILSKFWGTQSFDDWMGTRFIELNDLDPNTFVITEWKEFDETKEKPQPYPYESKSHEAVMFEYFNNILEYLVDYKAGEEKYTMYLKDQTIQARQVTDEDLLKTLIAHIKEVGEPEEIDGMYYFKKSDKVYFEVILFEPHKLGRVPAFRAGYKRDEVTDGNTFVSPYHDAVPYLKKTLKTNSELDLTMCLHAFPQKLIAANKCTNPDCYEGQVSRDGKMMVCQYCQGTGFNVHTSAQDVVYVPIPKGKDEQLSLDNLAKYLTPEVALLEFQRDYIEYLTNECMQAVFNSDIFTKEEVATTATEKRIDLDNVYDTLYPLAVKYSKTWKFGVKLIADIVDMEEDLVINFSFSKDFKFKSKDDYIRDRAAAKEAGAPDTILRNIDDEIMRIDTADDPHGYQIYKTIESFDPFSGKNNEEIATIMAMNTVPFEIKVLYDNLGWIFDQIFIEKPNFYELNRKEQVKIVDKKVKKIIKQLEDQQPRTTINNAQ